MKKYILGITGASGSVIGLRLLEELLRHAEVHLVVSGNTFPIIRDETGSSWEKDTERKIRKQFKTDRLFFYEDSCMEAPLASGSFKTDGMLIVPCSMKTLSAVASGYANNLIERAADVTIKEGRFLLLSPREMPFSAIHLENMLKLARLGVVIAPPVPAFYHKPKNMDDMLNFIVGKILDRLGLEHDLFRRWGARP